MAGVPKCYGLRQYSLVLLYCQQSAAALSAAAAAATCVCRTSLYTYMYYALQYGLCLALFVYGCAVHAILLCLRNLTLSNNQGNTEDFFFVAPSFTIPRSWKISY